MDLFSFQKFAFVFLAFVSCHAWADQPWSTSVDGRLFRANSTTPLRDASLVFVVQILNPSRNCVLYEESQTLDTLTTNGFFNLRVGSRSPDLTGKRTISDPGFSMAKIFNNTLNSYPVAANCLAGYVPADGDARYLRLTVEPSSGGSETLSPDIALTSVPSAKVAETVGGLSRSQILNVNTSGTNRVDMPTLESIFNSTQLPILNSLLSGTSSLYMKQGSGGAAQMPTFSGNASGASAGEVWYDSASNTMKFQSNTGPQTLGSSGSGVTSITAGAGLNVGLGPGGTISTSGTLNVDVGTSNGQIVQVQSGGKLPALNASDLTNVNGSAIQSGTIGGSVAINTSGNLTTTGTLNSGSMTSSGNISGANLTAANSVTANDARLNALRVYRPLTAHYIEFVADGTLSAPVSFTLPAAHGTNGQVLQTDASGKLSWASVSNVPSGASGGDLGGTYPNPSVDAVRGNAIAAGILTGGDTGKIYRWSGTQFEAVNFGIDDLRTEAGLSQFATNCNSNQTLTWSAITDGFSCTTISLNANQITAGTLDSARLPVIGVDKGGTGLSTLGTANHILGVNAAGNAAEYKAITGGAGVTVSHSAGGIQISAPGTGGTVTNVSGSGPIGVVTGTSTPVISISQATTSTDGYLSSTDWNTFNGKQASGNYLTGMSGDVVATGPGSVTATIQANAITTGKINDGAVTTSKINDLAVTDAKINDVAWGKITGTPTSLSGYGIADSLVANGGGTPSMSSATEALRPAVGTAGRIFVATDTRRLFRDTGSVWEQLQVNASDLISGTLPAGRLPAFTGDVTSSAGSTALTLGTVPISKGGTGQITANAALNSLLPSQTSASGRVLQSNGTDASWVAPNAGTVTSVSGSGPISVATGTTTPAISIAQANTTTAGYLSSADWNTFNNKVSTSSLSNYVLKAGDAMTGALNLPNNGFVVGTNQLVVSGGNIGIGTASPTTSLEISSNSPILRLTDSAGPLSSSISGGSGNLHFTVASAARDVVLNAGSGNPVVTFKGGGNVGIGLTNPSQKLEVNGNIKGSQLCIGADCRNSWPLSSSGTVTSVTSANLDIAVATDTTTPVLTLNSGTGANQILKLNSSSEIPAVSGNNLTNLNASNLSAGTIPVARLPALAGDVSSSAGSNNLTLSTVGVAKGGTGTTSFVANKLVSTGGTGTAFSAWSCAPGEMIKFDGSGVIGCDTIAGILGYTPANGSDYVAKTGSTMSGALALPSNGLAVGTNQLHVSGGNVGIGTASPDATLEVSGSVKMFGTRSALALGTVYGPASSDGFLIVSGTADGAVGGILVSIHSDTFNPPTTNRGYQRSYNNGSAYLGTIFLNVPIKKGEYYRILCNSGTTCGSPFFIGGMTAYFLSLGN